MSLLKILCASRWIEKKFVGATDSKFVKFDIVNEPKFLGLLLFYETIANLIEVLILLNK